MPPASYDACDGLDLAALVRTGQVSAAELVEEAIRRIETLNPGCNAVIHRMDELARTAARAPLQGPFAGVPFLLKDHLAACAGVPLSSGSRLFEGYVPPRDSTLVARYRKAGLLFVGKTNLPELGIAPVTEPRRFGPTHNPWLQGYTAGGSSGGSAAAVAAGMVPMAHGNDGGGSLRIPASCCGLFGLKPSRGRVPVGPDRSEVWGGFVVDHALTRSVRDSAALLDASAGPAPGELHLAPPPARPFLEEVSAPAGRLRVAFSTRPHLPGTVHPDCVAAARDTAALMASLGHDVEEVDLAIDPEPFARAFFVLACVDTAVTVANAPALLGRAVRREDLETSTWLLTHIGGQRTALEAARARAHLLSVARMVSGFHERYDLLLTPTLGLPPVPHHALMPRGVEAFAHDLLVRARLGFLLRLPGIIEANVKKVFAFIPFTPLANVTGQPSMSVPLHWNGDGLPIGSMLTGRHGEEATLFRVAAALEQARPWARRRPGRGTDDH